jgi:hypothetical protein
VRRFLLRALRGRPAAAALAFAALAATTWAALAPIHVAASSAASRDEIFVIPKGTWARRMAGEKNEILPDHIRLVLGIRDILVLKNADDVPQIFGPTLMMPGQSLRLPFRTASTNQFSCTAHASGQMTVEVEAFPDNPWARLRWRVLELVRRLSPAPDDAGA